MARRHRNKPKEMGLQITSMMDMFTVLVVFLLQSFGNSSIDIQISKGLTLPLSSSDKPPIEILNMIVDNSSIIVDGKLVIKHEKGQIDATALDETGFKIVPLFEELKKHSEKAKFIAQQNAKFDFEGKILLQMDKELPFSMLRQVMYTAGQAEYTEFKFVAIKNGE